MSTGCGLDEISNQNFCSPCQEAARSPLKSTGKINQPLIMHSGTYNISGGASCSKLQMSVIAKSWMTRIPL